MVMEKAVHPADSYGNSRVVYKYLSYTFICFQALKSQQKHKVIQHPAGPAPVNVFIFPAVRESRREEKRRSLRESDSCETQTLEETSVFYFT